MAIKVKYLEEQRKDVLMVDVRLIEPDFSWNPREDYGDITELSKDIELHGVKKPLQGRRNPEDKGKFLLTDGFRRYKACMDMLQRRPDIKSIRIPLQLEVKGYNEEDRLIDTFISNNYGKPLNFLEVAGVVKRLTNFGWSEQEIGERLHKTKTFINNCYSVLEAPEMVKNLIRKNKIAPTLVIDIFRKHKDFNEAVNLIKDMVSKLDTNDASDKITAKSVQKAQGKVNSVLIFKKMFTKTHTEKMIREDRAEFYEFSKKLVSGQASREEIEQYFFM